MSVKRNIDDQLRYEEAWKREIDDQLRYVNTASIHTTLPLSHVAVSRAYSAAAMSSSSALCIELVTDHDAPAKIVFNADFFEIEAFDIWPTAGGDKNNICLELMNFRL